MSEISADIVNLSWLVCLYTHQIRIIYAVLTKSRKKNFVGSISRKFFLSPDHTKVVKSYWILLQTAPKKISSNENESKKIGQIFYTFPALQKSVPEMSLFTDENKICAWLSSPKNNISLSIVINELAFKKIERFFRGKWDTRKCVGKYQ